jgi:hypothetical protein
MSAITTPRSSKSRICLTSNSRPSSIMGGDMGTSMGMKMGTSMGMKMSTGMGTTMQRQLG